MTTMVPIAMLGWFFVAVPLLFILLPSRTAAFCGLIFGWLLLPWAAKYGIGPIDVTRESAVTYPVILCIMLFDTSAILRLRPSWMDLPVVVLCVSPFFTSLSNNLGIYDGLSSIRSQLEVWGLPYLIGRIYVTNIEALRHLAMVLIAGAVMYIPLILWEARMSPQLHRNVYGYVTYDHGGTALRRLGGYRPLVFMRHGLMLGVFMAVTVTLASWLWLQRSVVRFPLLPPSMRGKRTVIEPGEEQMRKAPALGPAVPFWMVVGALLVTTLLCRALNGFILLVFAFGALFLLRQMRWRIGIIMFALLPFLFFATRMSEDITGLNFDDEIVSAIAMIEEDRAGSLDYRFANEHLLLEKAMVRPMLGWGGWGRNRVYDEDGNDLTVTDGYWIITLGQKGLVGLGAVFLTLLLPVFVLMRRFRAAQLLSPELAAATAMAVAICMYAMDCIPNAMLNPMYVMATGGLTGLLVAAQSKKRRVGRSRNRWMTPEMRAANV